MLQLRASLVEGSPVVINLLKDSIDTQLTVNS